MTETFFDEETEEQANDRFDRETAEIGEGRIQPEGVVIPPDQSPEEQAVDAFPLESLITVDLCGLLFSLPGTIRAKQTGHDWWKLDQEEKTLIGTASQPLIVYLVRRYLGDGVGMYAATAAALAAVYLPRQMREIQEQAEAKKQHGPGPAKPNGAVPHSPEGSQPSSVNEDAVNPASSGEWGIPFRE